MAEIVQNNIEETLPEIYELQQIGVFSSHETKQILKNRTSFEYRMRRRISKKSDFIQYIDYELKLEMIKRSRIKKLGINPANVSEGVKHKVTQRIHFLFQKGLKKYKKDMYMWMKYVSFCKQTKSFRVLGIALAEALQHNPECDKLWILSAKNEMETNKNVTSARSLFHQALKFSPTSQKLWVEYFRLEILHVEKLKKRHQLLAKCDKVEPNEFFDYKVAKIVYLKAIKEIPLTADLLKEFVDVALKALDSSTLIMYIFDSALKSCATNIEIWIYLANFILVNLKDPNKCITILKTVEEITKSFQDLERITKFLLEHASLFPDVNHTLEELLSNIDQYKLDDCETVLSLLKMLRKLESSNTFDQLLCRAVQKFPKSAELWLFRIRNTIMSDKELELAVVTAPDCTEIVKEYINNLALSKNYSELKERIVSVCDVSTMNVFNILLDLVYMNEGIEYVRELFQNYSNKNTLPESCWVKMINLEMLEENHSKADNLHHKLCVSYKSLGNWKNYIKFCSTFYPEKLSTVIWKAKFDYSESQLFV